MAFDISEYVDVRHRLELALLEHPDLRVIEDSPVLVTVGERTYIQCAVTVYRSHDDTTPGRAYCWEVWPGRTPFTKDSEQMNGATSALGRCLGYMGFGIKSGLASADEVRTAKGNANDPRDFQTVQESSVTYLPKVKRTNDEACTEKQQSYIMALCKKHKQTPPDFLNLTKTQANDIIDHLKGLEQ
jgi:hypothetical protein